jgi:hypothetical protein
VDPEIIKQVQTSNEAAIALITLLVSDEDAEAIMLAMTDTAFTHRSTCLAVGVVASAAIKTLAQMAGCDPEEVVREAAINTALFNLDLDQEG